MLGLLVVTLTSPSWAIAPHVAAIPNGSFGGCNTCHENGGGTPRNDFGLDFDATSDWAQLAALDSDGDGCSNGAELGDPDGIWMPGDTPAGEAVSLPGDPNDVACSIPGDTDDPVDDDEGDDDGQGCSTVSAGLSSGALLSTLALAGLFGRRRRS